MAIATKRDKAQIKALFPCCIQGETFKNQKALTTRFGVSASTLQDRLRGGWPLEEAVGLVTHQKKGAREVTIQGITYPSLSAASRAHGVYHKVARARISNPKCNWSDDEGVEAVPRLKYLREANDKQPIHFKGQDYANLASAARAVGISPSLAQHRYRLGKPLDEVLSRRNASYTSKVVWVKSPVTVNDRTYPNPKAAASAYGLSLKVLWHRISTGWDTESAYTAPLSDEERAMSAEAGE